MPKFSMVHENVEQQINDIKAADKVGGAMNDLREKGAAQHRARVEEQERVQEYYETMERQQAMAQQAAEGGGPQARFAGDDLGYMYQDHHQQGDDGHQHGDGCCGQTEQEITDNQGLSKLGMGDDSDEDSDDEFLNDPEINKLRNMRLHQMKAAQASKQEQLAKGHGSYREVCQDDFLKEVACDDHCVVHFYHRDFEKCKLIDKHLPRIAAQHLETKFLKIDAEKCPFFVQKLQIRVLPCIIGFHNGIAKDDRIMGFEGLNEDLPEDKKDEWPTEALEARLGEMRVIKYTPPSDEVEAELKEKGHIFGSLAGDDLGDFEDYN